jgi:NAD(P)-dependent dehydrogenase (short-subunit alcohol dehydrogenase family)
MQKGAKAKSIRPKQRQNRPGLEFKMKPVPDAEKAFDVRKLTGKIALITGGDSGIGRAVAVLFAQHGASVAIAYLNEHKDARETEDMVTKYGVACLTIPGDLSKESNCKKAVSKTIKRFGKIDILVNNAGIHYAAKTLEEITTEQLQKTFAINFFSFVWVTKAALPFMPEGASIINTSSVTAYRGSASLMDYAATKGAIVSFTRSLSANLIKKNIRVNGVAPGPIWTPLIASSFDPARVAKHGSDAPMARAGEPWEVAGCYLFLASSDAAYMTGQFLHPNGGEIVNG